MSKDRKIDELLSLWEGMSWQKLSAEDISADLAVGPVGQDMRTELFAQSAGCPPEELEQCRAALEEVPNWPRWEWEEITLEQDTFLDKSWHVFLNPFGEL